VRIVSTLLCCCEPAMVNLAGALDKNRNFWNKYYISDDERRAGRLTMESSVSSVALSSSSSTTSATATATVRHSVNTSSRMKSAENCLTENEWKDFRGELLLIRFLHQLYCECAGFVEETQDFKKGRNSATVDVPPSQPTMRLEDLQEMFTCCVTNLEDEHTMIREIAPMLEYLFKKLHSPTENSREAELGMALKSDNLLAHMVNAENILKFGSIKTMFSRLTVTVDDLLDAVLTHSSVLKEFIRQVRNFRKEAQPYVLGNHISIDDAVSLYSNKL
jgi:hypothetical protein